MKSTFGARLSVFGCRVKGCVNASCCLVFAFIIHHSLFVIGADWPQLQCDARRTGYTDDQPKPPFTFVWERAFGPERVSQFVQAIVSGGKVFVPTKSGRVHALRIEDGEPVWTFDGAGPVIRSVGVAEGRVYFASLDGRVYALDAGTGALLWRFPELDDLNAYRLTRGFSSAPCLANGAVYVGSRRGTLYALNGGTGGVLWECDSGAPIFGAAACNDGRVFCGNDDMRVFAVDAANGALLWRTGRLNGQTMRDTHPVVSGGRVLYHTANHCPTKFQLPLAKETLENAAREGVFPAVSDEDNRKMLAVLEEFPYFQELYVLDEETGESVLVPVHTHAASLDGVVWPPAIARDGNWIIPTSTTGGVTWTAVVELDHRTGLMKRLLWAGGMGANSDENIFPSVGGSLVFMAHPAEGGAGYFAAFDLDSGRAHPILRPKGAGIRKGIRPPTVNSQSGGNAAVISGNMFFHILADGTVGAWEGAKK